MNAIRFPEGCHDGCETSKSPFVSWRGLAPARAGTRNRCSRLSRVPPSSCQSVVRMTRATCFFGSPVQNRTSSPCETNAIRAPVGRPERSAHGAMGRCADALGLAAVGVDQEELGFGLVVRLAGVGPVRDEGDRAPVGRPCRRRVAPFPVGEPPWPPAGGRNQPEVHLVAVAGHCPPRVHDALPVRRDRRGADDDLAADDFGSRGGTSADYTGSIATRSRACASRRAVSTSSGVAPRANMNPR